MTTEVKSAEDLCAELRECAERVLNFMAEEKDGSEIRIHLNPFGLVIQGRRSPDLVGESYWAHSMIGWRDLWQARPNVIALELERIISVLRRV